ncbi:endolytic transglycosylase MltG [Draconibacterium halophilum]|uniref:Endolytic murein transglycosylase n=1 Tax=Draconibacterium halophilum TaxID=2706887 RepID=A0A6C0RDJ5_9BACT|nr:endolytic transglycosylase MltG [Draconibacterium halophilum]QIA07573.1 endolytic transglycosylase MltG [Draconibacterium halophilum]
MTIDQKSRAMTFPRVGKYIIIFFAIAFIFAGARGYQLYRYVFEENVKVDYVILVTGEDDLKSISEKLEADQVLINMKAFKWVAKKKKYADYMRPGRYELKQGMNTNQLVNMLRSGAQAPVNITFNNVRFKEELAGKVSNYIKADSTSILKLFSDEQQIKDWGFTEENFRAMFIPNTYEMYWTTTAEEFAERMKTEYDRFWNDTRTKQAAKMGLTPQQVVTLASIVQSETIKPDELKTVAGLYINRLNKNILLQADPTVKYAVGDYSIKRVLNKHLEIDSPYNTYKYAGLPPGPICFPEITSIDAVLNYEDHKYLYMCAREDFSGYHSFARTLSQHNRNAKKYRDALNERRIYE